MLPPVHQWVGGRIILKNTENGIKRFSFIIFAFVTQSQVLDFSPPSLPHVESTAFDMLVEVEALNLRLEQFVCSSPSYMYQVHT